MGGLNRRTLHCTRPTSCFCKSIQATGNSSTFDKEYLFLRQALNWSIRYSVFCCLLDWRVHFHQFSVLGVITFAIGVDHVLFLVYSKWTVLRKFLTISSESNDVDAPIVLIISLCSATRTHVPHLGNKNWAYNCYNIRCIQHWDF